MGFKFKKNATTLFSLLFSLSLTIAPQAKAVELVISENGSSSNSQVNVEVSSTTDIQQPNTADVSNSITSQVNTGRNSASGNTQADVGIKTGDSNTQVSTQGSANFSKVNAGCCSGDTNVSITGNGSGSSNEINLSQTNTLDVSVNQGANTINSIDGTADTGDNSASDNTTASVSIQTGNINARAAVVNGPINIANVSLKKGPGRISASIKDNGSDSKNSVLGVFLNETNVFTDFSSNIGNFVVWDLNTGGNITNGNTGGDVSITTGDIDLGLFISNLANIGRVEVACCPGVFDPGKGGSGQDEEEEEEEGEKQKDEDNEEEEEEEGELLPYAAATEAGGPGIVGLSDTSSESANTLFFWIALAMIAFGGKIVVDEILPESSVKRSQGN